MQAAFQKLGLKNFNDLHSYVRSQSPELDICYEIATGAKHFILTSKPLHKQVVTDTRASAGPSVAIAGLPFYVLKVMLTGGQDLRALDVFKQALQYWDAFFSTHQL